MRRQYRIIAASLLLGCGSDGGLAPNAVDVSGSWAGDLTYQTVVQTTNVAAFAFALVQTGSQVTGTDNTATGTGTASDATISGTQTGSSLSLTITASKVPGDDCHLYPVSLTFDVGNGVLTLKSISGVECRGDGKGGHRSLDPITGGTLTMRKK